MNKDMDKQSADSTGSNKDDSSKETENGKEYIDLFSIKFPPIGSDEKQAVSSVDADKTVSNEILKEDAPKVENSADDAKAEVKATDGTSSSDDSSPSDNADVTVLGADNEELMAKNQLKTENNFKNGYNGVKTEDEEDEEEEDGLQDPHKRKMRILKAFIYTMSVIVVSVLLTVLILFSVTDFLGMFRPYKTCDVTIPKNATTGQVADILQNKGVIRSALFFKIYTKVSGKGGLKDGIYSLNSTMSYVEVIRALHTNASRVSVKVTIPEGFSVQKIAKLLEQKGVCKSSDFLNAANNAKTTFDYSKEYPKDKKRLYRFEGYVFPDTYDFYLQQSADSVVKKMLDNFDKRVGDKDIKAMIEKSGMSVDDTITLASVIQAETGGSGPIGKVSSVFHNRLKNGAAGVKMLQSDVTTLYGKNIILPTLGTSAQDLADSYDTYKVKGLPAGPVCNPGIDAIRAACSPDDTNFYYFVTDSKGNYYFASTLNQHQINVRKASKNGNAVGTNT